MSLSSNKYGNLCLHKTTFSKRVSDYQINFKEVEVDFNLLLHKTFDLFLTVMTRYKNHHVLGRLIAKVNFIHTNSNGVEQERSYHFPSFKAHEIEEPLFFFKANMMKIVERLDTFNKEGSNLVLKNIEHIHILITKL